RKLARVTRMSSLRGKIAVRLCFRPGASSESSGEVDDGLDGVFIRCRSSLANFAQFAVCSHPVPAHVSPGTFFRTMSAAAATSVFMRTAPTGPTPPGLDVASFPPLQGIPAHAAGCNHLGHLGFVLASIERQSQAWLRIFGPPHATRQERHEACEH